MRSAASDVTPSLKEMPQPVTRQRPCLAAPRTARFCAAQRGRRRARTKLWQIRHRLRAQRQMSL